MSEEMDYACPLCGIDFSGAACHSSCPLARGCAMVRCPRCGYEFVGRGRLAQLLSTLFQRRSDDDARSSR
jgi:hypothetical protein